MRLFRGVGTLVAAAAGAAAGVGVGGSLEDPFLVGAAATAVALAVGYVVGHRGWIVFAGALAHLAVGVAVVRDAVAVSMAQTQVGAAYLGVGVAVTWLFLLRWQAGNLKRLSTRPVGAGRLRGTIAAVAGVLRGGRSLVRRLAGVRLGTLPVGAVLLLALWLGVVVGSGALGTLLSRGAVDVEAALGVEAGLARPLSAALAPVTLVPYLAGLLVPLYVATDWFGLDGIEDPPETDGVLARAVEGSRPATGAPAVGGVDTPEGGRDEPAGGAAPADAERATAERSPAPETGAGNEPPGASGPPDDAATGTAGSDPTDGGGPPAPESERPRHWPGAEDNPWTDGETDDTPAESDEDPGETGEVASASEDDAGSAPDTEDPLSDDRITFGEPTEGRSGGDEAETTGDEPGAGEAEDAGSGPTAWETPPAAGDEDDAAVADGDASTTDDDLQGGDAEASGADERSEATETETRSGKVADRVSRILDGDLDASEIDSDSGHAAVDADDGESEDEDAEREGDAAGS